MTFRASEAIVDLLLAGVAINLFKSGLLKGARKIVLKVRT